MSNYHMADLFCVRITGVPFDALEDLGTPESSAAARQALSASAPDERASAARDLDRLIEQETSRAREALWRHARAVLPHYLLFGADEFSARLETWLDGDPPRQPSEARRLERTLLNYLQRLAAKNDTFSRFGPIAWGRVGAGTGFTVEGDRSIVRREVQVERWVIQTIVAAINGDEEARAELAPRIHPNGCRAGDRFVRHDTGSEIPLEPDDAALLDRCDGVRPALEVGRPERLAALTAAGVILWELELVAWDSAPLATLAADIASWRDGDVKTRWRARVDEVRRVTDTFAATEDPPARRALVARVVAIVEELGRERPTTSGRLYAGTNPIVEECMRGTQVVIGREAADRLTGDIAPWLDLYRDTYAFAASHAYARLRQLVQEAPRVHGELSLAGFRAHCQANDVDFRAGGLARLASEAFEVVRADLREVLAPRAQAAEWQLGDAELGCIRRRHRFPPMEAYTWPSADLAVCASSPEAAARGELDWVVAELHTLVAPILHPAIWCCPDVDAVFRSVRGFVGKRPWLAHSRAGFLANVHTTCDALLDAFPSVYCAPERARPGWRAVAPADALVELDEEHHDVVVCSRAGEDLGSLVRNMWLFYGFHPFFPVQLPGHTPRLRVGRAVVQRRTWQVSWEQLAAGAPDLLRSARQQLLAVERLRADIDLPRRCFMRPLGGALERTEAFSRDKDVKPTYVDLESVLFVDVFLRRLQKFGQVELSEMLPAPGQMSWQEPDGGYCFELRTIISR